MNEFENAVMSEFTDAIDAYCDKQSRANSCDVRFTFRDSKGTRKHWYKCDQNDLAQFVKYMRKSNDLTWVLCQCLSGIHAGEWRFMSASTNKWREPSERLLSQILYDTFHIHTVGYDKVREEREAGLIEIFG